MLAYAANRPVAVQRRSSPNAMLAVIAVHVAVIAAVMSAKMDVSRQIFDRPTSIELIPAPKPPPPEQVKQRIPQRPIETPVAQLQVPLPPAGTWTEDSTSSLPDLSGIGASTIPQPHVDPIPPPRPVKVEPTLLTPASELKPPYPESKLASGEEALLKLRLTIDERGRVVAVEPLGEADPIFLDAARRYLIAHWRYRPASEDGHPTRSSTVITLRFQLDG
jgi:periplasmic protein TonB